MNRPRLAAAIATILAGCGGTTDPADAGPPATVEIGTGTVDWEPLTTDQELVLIAGPQGGHHFIVHARIRHMSPGDPRAPGQAENPSTQFQAHLDSSNEAIQLDLPPYRLGYGEPDDEEFYYLASGRLLIVDDSDGVSQWFGQRMRVGVTVTDHDGRTATDTRTITVAEDPGPEPDAGPPDAGPLDAGPADATALVWEDGSLPDARAVDASHPDASTAI